MNAPITRKEIAGWLKQHERTIGRNERKLGLDKARANCGTKRVLYNHDSALSILVGRGLLSAPAA